MAHVSPVEFFDHVTLDISVAVKVMGWSCERGLMHGREQLVFTESSGSNRSVACGCSEDFNPSIEIAAAWQVVERMTQLGYFTTISDSAGRWYAAFSNHAEGRYGYQDAATAMEAICHAALMAVGANDQ